MFAILKCGDGWEGEGIQNKKGEGNGWIIFRDVLRSAKASACCCFLLTCTVDRDVLVGERLADEVRHHATVERVPAGAQ